MEDEEHARSGVCGKLFESDDTLFWVGLITNIVPLSSSFLLMGRLAWLLAKPGQLSERRIQDNDFDFWCPEEGSSNLLGTSSIYKPSLTLRLAQIL